MKLTVKEVAELLKGEIIGDENIELTSVSRIEQGKEGSITFLGNAQYEKYIYTTKADAVIINRDLIPKEKVRPTLIVVDNAYRSFASLLELCEYKQVFPEGIEYPCYISPGVQLGKNIYIGAFTYIAKGVQIGNNTKIFPNVYIGENVKIGSNTIVYSGVRIYKDCIIGDNCIIHSNSVIGSDGFGFTFDGEVNKKIPQIGNVIIEDNVEIGANTTIDRATIGSTIIHKGVKLDNLIQVAHNVEIGENTVIASQTGISGSTKIGKGCMIGGQVGIAGHLYIADKAKIAAQSGIGSSITEEGEIIQGSPAFNKIQYQKSYILFKHLPEFIEKLERLEKEVELLKNKK
ncbi:MAG: UDP-3-O-(3-hydroxymyristoyl)glucosamine N-acyltransferase [Bacteroidales bacterium]|nr:UDP-3-O-(3-hydroxymyristoyl)glucosamine N-acyltransferase [Bacteroidales bacterium]